MPFVNLIRLASGSPLAHSHGQGTENQENPQPRCAEGGMTVGAVSIPHVCLVLNVNVMVGTTGQAPPFYFNSETFYTSTSASFE